MWHDVVKDVDVNVTVILGDATTWHDVATDMEGLAIDFNRLTIDQV